MIKIFDMVNGIFETPGNPDVPVSPPTGHCESGRDYEPEDMRPRLQEAPCGEETHPQPDLPPVLIDVSIDSFIRRQ
ncbi:MAG TPA: hypothetical protein ENI64_05405 [Gammaproteobacteria bacterium]|nr:hypothetical protein [Gammaproteobacteria bacterium]